MRLALPMLQIGLAAPASMCHDAQHMKRTNFFYPEALLDRLSTLRTRTGISASEHIRRAIEEYLKRNKA